MYLQYSVGIKNRSEITIVSEVKEPDPSFYDKGAYIRYKRTNEMIRIRDCITDDRAFQIEEWIFNPKTIDYVIVSIVED